MYEALTWLILAFGCEAWTIRENDETRISAAETQFIRCTAGCTKWDHKWNEEIVKALKTVCVLEHIGKQIQNWRDNVNRMVRRRMPKQILLYVPRGRWSTGQLAKMAQDHNRPHALEDYDIILPISYFMLLLPHTLLHFLFHLFPFLFISS